MARFGWSLRCLRPLIHLNPDPRRPTDVRNRIFGLSFAIVAALYANVAAAHAVLVSSSPANGSMLTLCHRPAAEGSAAAGQAAAAQRVRPAISDSNRRSPKDEFRIVVTSTNPSNSVAAFNCCRLRPFCEQVVESCGRGPDSGWSLDPLKSVRPDGFAADCTGIARPEFENLNTLARCGRAAVPHAIGRTQNPIRHPVTRSATGKIGRACKRE